jgi:hypothetical protein
LTITRDDFSNFLHRDNDHIGVAYGWWWVAGKENGEYILDDTRFKQSDVKGGAFLFGDYSIGVDFERYIYFYTCIYHLTTGPDAVALLKFSGEEN